MIAITTSNSMSVKAKADRFTGPPAGSLWSPHLSAFMRIRQNSIRLVEYQSILIARAQDELESEPTPNGGSCNMLILRPRILGRILVSLGESFGLFDVGSSRLKQCRVAKKNGVLKDAIAENVLVAKTLNEIESTG